MNNRPLSPHISIYHWPITMVLSILHRATGIAMSVGLIVFAAWLLHAAQGPESYQYFRVMMSGIVGQLLLIGWTFAFFLHLGNGVRHLFWDTGRGLEKHQANASAWFVIVFAAILTAGVWVILL